MSCDGKSVYHSFNELPKKLKELIERTGKENLFLSMDWYALYESSIVQNDERLQLYVSASEDVVLPMLMSRNKHFFQAKTLKAMSNFYTTHYSATLKDESVNTSKSLQQIVSLISKCPLGWDVIDVKPLRAEGRTIKFLKEGLSSQGWFVQTYFSHGNWYLPTKGMDFTQYIATRGSQIRKTVANRVRKFDRLEESRFEVISDKAGLARAICAYKEVYRLRWGKNEPYAQFIDNLANVAAENGWLRLGVAWMGTKPVASQLWILRNGKAYMYKVAYDQSCSEYSIGSVATYKMIENILDNNDISEIDFLTGDDPYKKVWVDQRREFLGLLAINPRTIRGILKITKILMANTVKSLISRFNQKKSNVKG